MSSTPNLHGPRPSLIFSGTGMKICVFFPQYNSKHESTVFTFRCWSFSAGCLVSEWPSSSEGFAAALESSPPHVKQSGLVVLEPSDEGVKTRVGGGTPGVVRSASRSSRPSSVSSLGLFPLSQESFQRRLFSPVSLASSPTLGFNLAETHRWTGTSALSCVKS